MNLKHRLSTWPWNRPETQAVVGGLVWCTAVAAVRPSVFEVGWAQALLMLSPLALAPLALGLAEGAEGTAETWRRRAAAARFWAALALGGAYFLPQGSLAGALALPWLGASLCGAASGGFRIEQAMRTGGKRFDRKWLSEVCISAGLLFWAVGAGWAAMDRAGMRPLGFEPVIVLLTGVHFHYAGLLLPIAVGCYLKHAGEPWAMAAGWLSILGVPGTAVGITATQLGWGWAPEWLAAWSMSVGGILAGLAHFRHCGRVYGPTRWLMRTAAVSLWFSMALAAMYGGRFFLPVPWLDIPWMRALHGSANALGFGLCGMWAWRRVEGGRR